MADETEKTRSDISLADAKAQHPKYAERQDDWRLMRDAISGEGAVKAAGQDYLPMPLGFKAFPDAGVEAYKQYMKRASFPEFTDPTLSGLAGMVHRKEAKIDMPDAMAPLFERATLDGQPLEQLHRAVTAELLAVGRVGLLADAMPVSEGGSEVPFLSMYVSESIRNWDDAGTMYVLDESGPVLSGLQWEDREQYRVLMLQDGQYVQIVVGATTSEMHTPKARGEAALEDVPFVVVNTKEVSRRLTPPPLMAVARAAVNIYQLSADHRHQLFSTGQETLFCFNMDAPERVGAGVIVTVKSGSKDNPMPDAKYVGPSGSGIAAHRQAILDERESAASAGARLMAVAASSQESGEARKMRLNTELATLLTISMAGAQAMEKALRHVAVMMGLNPDDVVVTPNLDFFDEVLTPQEATYLVSLWQEKVLSYDTLYELLRRGRMASDERSAEDERKAIDEEGDDGEGDDADPAAALLRLTGALNPQDPTGEQDGNDA